MAVIIQTVFCFNIACEAICLITFSMSTFFTLIAITEDVKGDLFSINMTAHNKSTAGNRMRITQKFSGFIEFHWSAIQLSEQLNHEVEKSIFMKLQAKNHNNLITILCCGNELWWISRIVQSCSRSGLTGFP